MFRGANVEIWRRAMSAALKSRAALTRAFAAAATGVDMSTPLQYKKGPDPERALGETLDDALNRREIKTKAAEAGIQIGELRQTTRNRSGEILAACAAEWGRFEEARLASNRLYWTAGDNAEKARNFANIGGFTAGVILALYVAAALTYATGSDSILQSLSSLPYLIAPMLLAVVSVGAFSIFVYFKYHSKHLKSGPDAQLVTARLRTTEEKWRESLREHGVMGHLREEINRRKPSYSKTLDIEYAAGLAELEDPQFLIPMPAQKEIERLLQSMPGGSIGLSGPRGVGKTTLLRRFCSPDYAWLSGLEDEQREPEGDEGVRAVRVLLSAPVTYDSREFVLHLFASVCRAVSPDQDHYFDQSRRFSPPTFNRYIIFRSVQTILFLLALWGVFLLASVIFEWKLNPSLRPAIILLSLALVGTAVLINARYRFGRSVSWGQSRDYWGQSRGYSDEVERQATLLLQGLVYQESVSAGWSAGIKSPVGLEGGVTSNTTMTEKPMGFPELVARFNEFLRLVTRSRPVFIGIDELDKVDSDDQVYKFINDIKAVFGLEGCFYVVSISDNAMSSFERRGLPVRDAFDSAFDCIVSLRPMDLSASRRLLRQRVIGMPEAFICLCHALSGGLPRDLIRAARDLINLAAESERDRTIETLSALTVRADIRRKADAASIRAQRIGVEPEVGNFVCSLRENLLSGVIDDKGLLDTAKSLARDSVNSQRRPSTWQDGQQDLTLLRSEMGAYFYFCSTVMRFFDNSLEESKLRRILAKEGRGSCDQLSQSRNEFSLNSRMAWNTLTEFRGEHGLSTATYPGSPRLLWIRRLVRAQS